jgi:hypothetical protein
LVSSKARWPLASGNLVSQLAALFAAELLTLLASQKTLIFIHIGLILLSSKERRQLRNKVSARAFRSRRKGMTI